MSASVIVLKSSSEVDDFLERRLAMFVTAVSKRLRTYRPLPKLRVFVLKTCSRTDLSSSDASGESFREYGFMPHVDFIVGNPDETEEEQFALVDFMEEMIDKYAIKVHMHTFTPLPSTPWEHKQQSPINETVKQRLRALEKTGHLDGWWENHIGYFRTNQSLEEDEKTKAEREKKISFFTKISKK